jgi:hypothetical protein
MEGPGWLADLFGAVMGLVALYSAGRLVAAQLQSLQTHLDVDLAHVLMGVAMAGMLVTSVNFVRPALWEIVFVLLALWFVWRCYEFVTRRGLKGRDDDHVHHLSHYATHEVMALAMLYMYLADPARSGALANGAMPMSGATGTTADFVGLPLLFLIVLFSSGVWELDGIERLSPSGTRRVPETVLATVGGAAPAPAVGGSSAPSPVGAQPLGKRAQRARWLAPRLEAACHIAMCITMGYMLIVML